MQNLKILFEDNHLIAVEKPKNVPTQSDSSEDPDLFTMVKRYIKEKYDKQGNVYLGLLHRLDRPVGGIIVFAKTSKAAARISTQIQNREFKKTYLAVVEGEVEKSSATLKDYLFKDKNLNMVRVVGKNHKEAKDAELSYRLLDSTNNLSLLAINLKTGRSHQIRVQLSNIHHPIWGDHKYGDDTSVKTNNIALWAYKVELKHPITNELISIKLNPPKEIPWNFFDINR